MKALPDSGGCLFLWGYTRLLRNQGDNNVPIILLPQRTDIMALLDTIANLPGSNDSANSTNNVSRMPTYGANTRRQNQSRQDLVPATKWLNVGLYLEDGTFISPAGFGIPLDTLKPMEVSGQNQEFIDMTELRNAVLLALQADAAELAPGQAIDVTRGLSIQMRAVADKTAPSRDRRSMAQSIQEKLRAARQGTPEDASENE